MVAQAKSSKKKVSKKKATNDPSTSEPTSENTEDPQVTETTETETPVEEVPMSVKLNCDTYQVEIDPEAIEVKHNIRPIDKARAEKKLAKEIAERGLDRKPWIVEGMGGEGTYWTLDGGHRITALLHLKKKDPKRFAELFPNGTILAECRGPFESPLEYHLAQVQLNEGQETISANAVDAGFAVAKLIKEGANQATVAKALNKSTAWVSRHLSAHDNAISQIKTMVKNGKLSGKTLLDAAQGSEAKQKQLFEKLQKALKGLGQKEAKQTERSIVEEWARKQKAPGDKTRFPKKISKGELAHNCFDLYTRIDKKKKKDMTDYHYEVKGMLKGIALVFGADADSDEFDIEAWFRETFGREITAEENAQ